MCAITTLTNVSTYMKQYLCALATWLCVQSVYSSEARLTDLTLTSASSRTRSDQLPIQGPPVILSRSQLKVDEEFKREGVQAQLLMQVHDELLVETPANVAERVAEILKQEMESAVTLDVPLVVDVGIADNWMDAKP